MKKKLGFALGAGGSRGVAHIGFLAAMEEAGLRPDYIAGCSMGSVIGAGYASGMSVEEMKRAVFKLRLLDLIAPSGCRGGFFDTRKIRRLLVRHVGDIQFSDLKIPFRCVAVDMITQEVIEFAEGSVADAVVASSSIPSIFRPTEKDGMRLVDGGVLERVPYKRVRALGADVVVAVDVLGQKCCKEKCPGTLGVLLETIDVMDNARTKMMRERDKKEIDFWLEPELSDMSQYSFKEFEFACDKGYEIGKKYAAKIKKKLEK